MVTGASRLPHMGSLLENRDRGVLVGPRPAALAAVGGDVPAPCLHALGVVPPHEEPAREEAKDESDDGDAGVDAPAFIGPVVDGAVFFVFGHDDFT